jgi:hypothetical protein
MKSCKAQIKILLTSWFVVLAAASAFGQSNDDNYNRGTAAINRGDAIAARDAFCAIKDDYKDAKSQCTVYTGEAKTVLNLHNKRYIEGLQLLQDNKLDEAEAKFKSVRYGDRVEDAKKKLSEVAKLKQDKANSDAQAKASADADSLSKSRLDGGIAAYERGDFGAAKNQLENVTGRYQGDAQNYLNRINTFNAKMSEARGYEAAKNFVAAKSSYTEAARIKPDGPGDPLGAVTRVTEMAASGSAPSGAGPVKQQAAAANKDVVRAIDVGKYNQEGAKLIAKGDFKRARRYFGDVLAQDPNNADAVAGMKEIKDKDKTTGPANASEEDPLLAAAIRKFYEGSFEEAEFRLNNYIFNSLGKKTGLANFYAGATLLSRYYLSGASDQKLLADARRKFKEAKAIEGFNAPKQFMSPKIMLVFDGA